MYRLATALVAGLAIGLAYVADPGAANEPALARTIRFVSFFTIATNLLVVVAFVWPAVAPSTSLGRFLEAPGTRTAITGYMLVVGGVYHVLLAALLDAKGLDALSLALLHYASPAMVLGDWLFHVPRGQVRWSIGLRSLGYPLAYAGWILLFGHETGWYPYFFVDVPDLGLARVLANLAGLFTLYVGVAVALVALDRVLARFAGSPARSQ